MARPAFALSLAGLTTRERVPQRATARPASLSAVCSYRVVRKAGLEPARLAALAPKARASTNSATFAMPGDSTGQPFPAANEKRPARAGRLGVVGCEGFEPSTY